MDAAEKEADIRAHPDAHQHRDLGDLERCCFIDGAISLHLIDVHGSVARFGTNGGVRCDVASGPCACGAWH